MGTYIKKDDKENRFVLYQTSNTPVPWNWDMKTLFRWGYVTEEQMKTDNLQPEVFYEDFDAIQDFEETNRIDMHGKGDIVFYKRKSKRLCKKFDTPWECKDTDCPVHGNNPIVSPQMIEDNHKLTLETIMNSQKEDMNDNTRQLAAQMVRLVYDTRQWDGMSNVKQMQEIVKFQTLALNMLSDKTLRYCLTMEVIMRMYDCDEDMAQAILLRMQQCANKNEVFDHEITLYEEQIRTPTMDPKFFINK